MIIVDPWRRGGDRTNVFMGLLHCDDCKTKMVRYKDVSKYGKVAYRFICRVYAENLDAYCSLKSVREDDLFDCVYEALQAQIALTVEMQGILTRLSENANFQSEKKALVDKINQVRKKLKRVISLKSSLFEAYADNLLSESEYLFSKERYQTDTEVLQAELMCLEKESLRYNQTLTAQNRWITAFQKYKGEKTVTREMVVELIDSIWVCNYNSFEIFWKYKDEYQEILNYTKGANINE